MILRIGQRYLYGSGRKQFLAEISNVVDSLHADMKVVQDLGYGVDIGYVYSTMFVDDHSSWHYLPGQEAPVK